MGLTSFCCCVLNLAGRDKGGYYHELFLRSKRFLSHRIQRIKIKGAGARKPGSPETEPNFYSAPFLPSTYFPSKNVQGYMANTMLASGPNMYLNNGGSLSLHQLLASPTFGSSLPQQAPLAPPPLFHTSASRLMEAHYTQAHLQRLRMVPFHPERQMGAGFGQYHVPTVSDPQNIPRTTMALALSRVLSSVEQDEAAHAWSQSLYRGALG
jgi:hypothetical protein